MPITFYRYGRVSFDNHAIPPEEQAAATLQEFIRMQAAGELPADAIDGRFVADTEKARAVKFLHRPMGIHIAMQVKPGDRICVTAYDRLIESTVDACETLEWAKLAGVGLVFLDLRIDSSTPRGQEVLESLLIVKGCDRREHCRRLQTENARRRAKGLVSSGAVPLGYQIKTIIPLGGGKPMKYYMPWAQERQYGERIVTMHDELGLSFHQIAVNFWIQNVTQPRSGTSPSCKQDVYTYYHRCKKDWPLRDGVKWKPPIFRYKLADNVLDLNDDCE